MIYDILVHRRLKVKMAAINAMPRKIPCSYGGKAAGWTGSGLTNLSTALVKVGTVTGLVGYGEAFSYNCSARYKRP